MERTTDKQEESKMKTIVTDTQLVKVVGVMGIVRTVEKKVDFDGKPYGHEIVWYDVCLEEGAGMIVHSFKRCRDAWDCAMDESRERADLALKGGHAS